MKKLLLLVFVVYASTLYAQSPDDLIKDSKGKCLVWATFFFPKNDLKVNWNGAAGNGYATGQGSADYVIGDKPVVKYTGEMRNGYPNGYGEFVFNNGLRMQGQFRDGIMNGEGKIVFPDSTKRLVGNFTDGEILNLDVKYREQLHKHLIAATDTGKLYENDRGKTELFYYALVPEKPRAAIVLLPGTWDRAEYTLSSNKALVQQAYENGVAVIAPTINQRLSLNEEVQGFLNTVFQDAVTRYHIPENKFIIGGFSMGGLFALRYGELSVSDSTKTAVHPAGVYSVDGPTDLETMYHNFEVALERSPNKAEPAYGLNEFRKYFGGSPAEKPAAYLYFSTYSYREKDGGNAKYLAKMPVRIYNDVDVNWWLANRNCDLYGMNALPQSAMINYLHSIGNKKAVFINAYQKGYRLDGTRHPHSWSIAPAEDVMPWVLEIIQ
ncbi:hypothetical protein [Chitinophaga sp. Cy-1792]|uniref:hypothetical protein n=1 Tax=Chitinophaga sp. Cy-1792 TaxID=2608339 RepID=UPI001420625F|nr:hypothetical protein [Chitinophaga sp. Cy-1792]NIG54082.1 hypothetical protein [Chitinophaga sp. Cy-1792]